MSKALGWGLASLPAAIGVYAASMVPRVANGNALEWSTPWLPGLEVDLAFRIDGLALLFTLLIAWVGAAVVLYAGQYMHGDPNRARFLGFLISFLLSMFGLVAADDIISMFVFWELTSLTSFFLIGFKYEKAESRRAARQALMVTGLGGLALLAGLIILSSIAGTGRLSELSAHALQIHQSPLYEATFLLIALGAMTKSAQFPFHFWLPNAMAAPTPVSALLHSATMVKAGIYLLMRMDPILGSTPLWTLTLCATGGITMMLGAVWAVRQTDLKRLLAYSTITALGTLTLLIGLSFDLSIKAAVVFLVVHALYKSALFLVAGSVEYATGTRQLDKLGKGLRQKMPVTFVAALVAALSMSGLPPLFGFIGKELTYAAKLGFSSADVLLPAAAVIANGLTLTAAMVLVFRTFGDQSADLPRTPREVPLAMWIGPGLLAALGALLGIYPAIAEPIVGHASSSIAGHQVNVDLVLWHGPNLALLLSGVTVAFGVGAYLLRKPMARSLQWLDSRVGGTADAVYDWALRGVEHIAQRNVRMIERLTLRHHLLIIFGCATAFVVFAMFGPLWADGMPAQTKVGPEAGWLAYALAALSALGAVSAAFSKDRVAILCSLGVAGVGVALLFLRLGAPDLAMTQIVVETLVVVVAVLALRSLPRNILEPTSGLLPRLPAAGIAIASGVMFTGLVWWIGSLNTPHELASGFAERSVPQGHGRNIVNVILVDFRALDTFGEIAVVAIAGLGLLSLMKRLPTRRPAAAPPSPKESA